MSEKKKKNKAKQSEVLLGICRKCGGSTGPWGAMMGNACRCKR
tara:strand:+ start:262 stop:390 length:129 start_codon:yes stop_codon:yes gene_type:complete